MRIAVVSDIHGNNTAFQAVIRDLRYLRPDLVFHGGDLVDGGSKPVDVLDQIRDLGWPGVLGNADEIYTRPECLDEFAGQSSAPASLWTCVRERAAATRNGLGESRIRWMRSLPRLQLHNSIALTHAKPDDVWRSPGHDASDSDLADAYVSLGKQVVIFGHIHRPFVRSIAAGGHAVTIANAGSVGLPYDGDRRAGYLLLDDGHVTIRRVEYDVEKEIRELSGSALPHSDWIAHMLKTGSPQLP